VVDILSTPGARDRLLGMVEQVTAIAASACIGPRGPFAKRAHTIHETEGSPLTASMFRDIKAGAAVEADHVIGDLIARAAAAKVPVPKLRTAYIHLKAYEKQRG